MEKEIKNIWKIMPFFYMVHNDDNFDDDYIFKGFGFLLSLFILPFTIPMYFIGWLFRNKKS